MNIDEAIKQIHDTLEGSKEHGVVMSRAALQLGLEALKRVKEARKKAYFTTRSLLPGETKKD